MADNIVGSLFGITPEMYQQQQIANAQAQAMQFAKLDPIQQSQFAMYSAGQNLPKAIGGLLGVEDPQLQAIRETQQLVSQFDTTTSKGLKGLVGALQQKAQETGNNAYMGMAQQAAEKYKTTLLNEATVTAKTREQLPNIAKLQAYRANAEMAGATTQQLAQIDAVIKAEGEGKGVKITMPGEQQDKELRTARGKKFIDLEDRAGIATNTLQVAQDFGGLIDKSFTGTAAGAKLSAAQLATALGVPVTGTTESEQLDQLFSALTLGQAKNLKGALSDKDVKFLKEAVGSRGLTTETLKNVVARIARDAQIDKTAYDKASQYYEQGGDIAKFNFAKAQEDATAQVNETLAKQRRLQELRNKANR